MHLSHIIPRGESTMSVSDMIEGGKRMELYGKVHQTELDRRDQEVLLRIIRAGENGLNAGALSDEDLSQLERLDGENYLRHELDSTAKPTYFLADPFPPTEAKSTEQIAIESFDEVMKEQPHLQSHRTTEYTPRDRKY